MTVRERVKKLTCGKGKFKEADTAPHPYCEGCEYLMKTARCPEFKEKKVKD